MKKIIAFGEILWDCFGSDRKIGGAPFNFSGHLARLGDEALPLTAIGTDDLGGETLKAIGELGIDTRWVSKADCPTGVCTVTQDADGKPHYDLVRGVAYDAISLTASQMAALKAENADLFYFGTLAQRDARSRATLRAILSEIDFPTVFCDINIRPPYYTAETLDFSLSHCHIVKVSREEYPVLEALGLCSAANRAEASEEAMALALAERYPNLRTVVLTLDKDGALLFDIAQGRLLHSEKPQSKLVSAVGAGDSFSACFVHNLLAGHTAEEAMRRGILLSDYVVTQLGAIPDYPDGLSEQIR